jgi:hypothetical protein
MRLRFGPKKIMDAQSVLNTLSTILTAADLNGCTYVAFYIVGSAGVASGAIQIEDCHDATGAYTGTWAAQGSAQTVVATTVKKVSITDVFGALRARISTVMGGGTVDVWAIGRG